MMRICNIKSEVFTLSIRDGGGRIRSERSECVVVVHVEESLNRKDLYRPIEH